jgi:hypothetical protein
VLEHLTVAGHDGGGEADGHSFSSV